MTSPKTLRIAVLMEAVQLSDIVGIDILGNLSQEYMKGILTMAPDKFLPFKHHAMDIQIHYVSSTMDPPKLTAGVRIVPTTTYDQCPRDLDIVLIGGPLPEDQSPLAVGFLKEAWERTPVFMTTCIGSMWLAGTGVLKGRKVTTNRGALAIAKQVFPDVEWLDQRWVIDSKPYNGEEQGELWTAGGAGCGIEMIARYCLDKFDSDFVRIVALTGLEFIPDGCTGQFYKDN